jgi:hypothetical protein
MKIHRYYFRGRVFRLSKLFRLASGSSESDIALPFYLQIIKIICKGNYSNKPNKTVFNNFLISLNSLFLY